MWDDFLAVVKIKIYPEWNVNLDICYQKGYVDYIKIYPEWNVNYLT